MTIFCYKKVSPTMRLGEKFQKARESRSLSLDSLSQSTRIPLKYLYAIESSRFNELPKAKAHRTAYIKEFAVELGLSPAESLEQFEQEAGFENVSQIHPHKSIKLFPFASISIFLRNATVFAMVLFFAGYLVWQVKGILEPPHLAIFSPSEGFVVSSPRTVIEGETEKETKLTVNGQEVMVSEEGKFATEIDLKNGVNTIMISATKKHGKTTTITRHIVVKLPFSGLDKQVASNY